MNKLSKVEKRPRKNLEELLKDVDPKIIEEIKKETKWFRDSPRIGKEII